MDRRFIFFVFFPSYSAIGVKSELAKISNRKVMQQMEQRRQTKQVEASLHEELVKEKQKLEEIKQEWKRDVNHLKVLFSLFPLIQKAESISCFERTER